jgi:GGDEF domain-containing protein
VAAEIDAAAERGESAAVVFVDIDELHATNDRRGFDAGNVAICGVANALAAFALEHEAALEARRPGSKAPRSFCFTRSSVRGYEPGFGLFESI